MPPQQGPDITVQTPDGGTAHFPAGTGQDAILKAMQQAFPESAPNLKTGAGMEFPSGGQPTPKMSKSILGDIHRSYTEHPYAELEGAGIGATVAPFLPEAAGGMGLRALWPVGRTLLGGVGGSAVGAWTGGEIAGEPGRKVGRILGGLAGGGLAAAGREGPMPYGLRWLMGKAGVLSNAEREAMSEAGVTPGELEIARKYYGPGGPGAKLTSGQREAMFDPFEPAPKPGEALSAAQRAALHDPHELESSLLPPKLSSAQREALNDPFLSDAERARELALSPSQREATLDPFASDAERARELTLTPSQQDVLSDPHARIAKSVVERLNNAPPGTAAKLGMSETLGSSGIRPSTSEIRASQLIRKALLTPSEAREESRLLGPTNARAQLGEGTMAREARALGTVRARRVARGMPEPY